MSIDVRNVSKRFGAFLALDDVSVTIPDGKLVALLGPSGSGKSTLLRIIAGLEVPDVLPGRPPPQVLIGGRDVLGMPAAQRRIGFVFQHYALFRHLTVFENIAFGLRVMKRSVRPPEAEIRRRVLELVSLMQLETLEGRYPSQLSGGQRQRVALARALATRPNVLLLDEPFGALDAKVRQDLRRWLRRLHEEIHITSVFVTHDQDEALELADRVVVTHRGRIEQEGTPDELFHRPATAFVAEFLGSVNLFHGRLEGGRVVVGPPPSGGAGGVAVAGAGGDEAGPARVYVRPHELELTREAHDGVPVVVQRVRPAGLVVKVEARALPDAGAAVNGRGDAGRVEVELSVDAYRRLGVSAGDRMYVRPRAARVFGAGGEALEDYVI
ncbi:MAG: sulfate/molybdate ABC transporter ATP-binding protein [Tepidisphaerales bacterium]